MALLIILLLRLLLLLLVLSLLDDESQGGYSFKFPLLFELDLILSFTFFLSSSFERDATTSSFFELFCRILSGGASCKFPFSSFSSSFEICFLKSSNCSLIFVFP